MPQVHSQSLIPSPLSLHGSSFKSKHPIEMELKDILWHGYAEENCHVESEILLRSQSSHLNSKHSHYQRNRIWHITGCLQLRSSTVDDEYTAQYNDCCQHSTRNRNGQEQQSSSKVDTQDGSLLKTRRQPTIDASTSSGYLIYNSTYIETIESKKTRQT